MSIIKAIYNAEPKYAVSKVNNYVIASITYNNRKYKGAAILHHEDKGFFSSNVGKTIALSKARQEALKDAIDTFTTTAKIKYQMYREVTNYGEALSSTVDPTGAFYRNMRRSFYKVANLKRALKKEQNSLRIYLKDQQKALQIVKSMRSKKDKDN